MRRGAMLATALAIVAALAGCAADPVREPSPVPPSSGAGSSQLAPGLHDREDGTVEARGWLVRVNLEGGFWAIQATAPYSSQSPPPGTSNNVAVISNADEFDPNLAAAEGNYVSVIGTRFDGASIRMAGQEIVVQSVTVLPDPGVGAAE